MQKQEKILSEGHRSNKDKKFWVQNIKVPFGIGHPHLHIKSSLYVCRSVQGSEIFKQNFELSWFIQELLQFFLFGFPQLWGYGRWWGYLGWPTIVYMSSGVFRGKESSNRIVISWLVQDLLNFGVLGSLQLWDGAGWWVGVWGHGGVPTHVHMMCMHAHACTHMYRNCKWLPTWRHPCLSCLTCICVCVHAHMCMCMHACMGHPLTHPPPPPST